jgi:hypothetical protein
MATIDDDVTRKSGRSTAFTIGSALKHLDRYVNEATWRYNRREAGEGARVNSLLAATDGKRLRYSELVS